MDKKNGFRNLSLSLLVRLGVSQPGEELVADTLKAKVVFACLQLVYTLITVLPTYFLYSSYRERYSQALFSLVQLRNYCALIGRELHSDATPALLCHKELPITSGRNSSY